MFRSRTAVAPLERLKILLQVQNPHSIKYNGTIQGLKYIWRTEGFRGLFKGNGTNCARIVPNSAVKFFSYEQASRGILAFYREKTGDRKFILVPYVGLNFAVYESLKDWLIKSKPFGLVEDSELS
ncbi:mitochondrial adenine nucleotide transporter ADNT1-like, partial [Cucurbita maxima]|uniref:Mitochondrial adenine nucleotide transporter ADNT1-like n=1 Tax=Cucurbita maxima TaxID=3661 RepID=A0A6J1ID76_CUCMA